MSRESDNADVVLSQFASRWDTNISIATGLCANWLCAFVELDFQYFGLTSMVAETPRATPMREALLNGCRTLLQQ
jgi:hypothetical protein